MLYDLKRDCEKLLKQLYFLITKNKTGTDVFNKLFDDFLELREFILVKLDTLIAAIDTLHYVYETMSNSPTLNIELVQKRFVDDITRLESYNEICAQIKVKIDSFNMRYFGVEDEAKQTVNDLLNIVAKFSIGLFEVELDMLKLFLRIVDCITKDGTIQDLGKSSY